MHSECGGPVAQACWEIARVARDMVVIGVHFHKVGRRFAH